MLRCRSKVVDNIHMQTTAGVGERSHIATSLAMLGFATLAAILLSAGLLDDRASLIVTDGGAIVMSGFAAGLCLYASRRLGGRARTGWQLLSLGMAFWALGELLWSYYEVLRNVDAPFPSVADVAYLIAYPLMLTGILTLTMPPRGVARLRTLFDAMLVAVLAAGPAWHYLIYPAATEGGNSVQDTIFGLGYPAGDLLLLFGIAVMTLRSWRDRSGLVFGVLSLGLVLFLASDFAFARLDQEGSYVAGSWVDGGWLLGYGLIALAAAMQTSWKPAYSVANTARSASAWRQVLPLVLLLPIVVWYMVLVGSDEPSGVVDVLVLLAVLLVVCRSALAVVDILALNGELVVAHEQALKANEELRRKSRQLNNLLLEAVDISRKDSLTGLFNRAAVVDELESAMREKIAPIHVAILDVDELKQVNDTGGHAAGDALLLDIASRLLTLQSSVVGRYGGDEFLAFTIEAAISADDFDDELRVALSGMEVAVNGRLREASASWGIGHLSRRRS